MADQVDVAQGIEEALRVEALSRHRRSIAGVGIVPPAARDCDGCGEAISPERLAAVPGATHCVPCLSELERKR